MTADPVVCLDCERLRAAIAEAVGRMWDNHVGVTYVEAGVRAALIDAAEATTDTAHPTVAGRCPACGARCLFLRSSGYVTCSAVECPNPTAVADMLDRPSYHVVEIGEGGWAIQHQTTCFPNLLDCGLHHRFSNWMDTLDGPPVAPGRYRLHRSGVRLDPLPVVAARED